MRLLPRRKSKVPTASGKTDIMDDQHDLSDQSAEAASMESQPDVQEEAGEAPSTESQPDVQEEAGKAPSRLQKPSVKNQISQIFSRRNVTLTLKDGVIRAVVFKGRKVVTWGTASLADKPLAEADDPDAQEKGQNDHVRVFLRELGVGHGRVVTDLPLHTALTRHLPLPKIGRRYLEQVILSEVSETIPFSVEEMDLAWHVRSNDTGQEALTVAVSKEAIDDHVRLMKESGIRIKAIYSKAAALAHACALSDGIVAHLEPSRGEFVLVRQWVPRAVYQMKLPESDTSPQQFAEEVSRAVEHVAGYHQHVGPGDGSRPLPVVLTGQLSSKSSLVEALQQALQRDVLPFEPPMEYPDHFHPSEYAANLGLALADQSRTKPRSSTSSHGVPSVNLLPERHLPRSLPVRPTAIFVALLLFGVVALT